MTSAELTDKLTGAGIDASVLGSDHCPVWATLTFADQPIASEDQRYSLQSVPRRPPPRLCARYLSHLAPTRSIQTLFKNVPGHIVLRSTEKVQPKEAPVEASKKRAGDLKQPGPKKAKTSVTLKPPSNESSTGQRLMNEFLEIKERPRSQHTTLQNVDVQHQAAVDQVDEAVVPEEEFDSKERGSSPNTASQQWTSIFTRKGPPLCDAHGTPCVELVTKKPGPNLGRRFWICSKPVGPGYDNGKRTIGKDAPSNFPGQKWEINPEYRCNFFKYNSKMLSFNSNCRWSSELK